MHLIPLHWAVRSALTVNFALGRANYLPNVSCHLLCRRHRGIWMHPRALRISRYPRHRHRCRPGLRMGLHHLLIRRHLPTTQRHLRGMAHCYVNPVRLHRQEEHDHHPQNVNLQHVRIHQRTNYRESNQIPKKRTRASRMSCRRNFVNMRTC